MKKRSVQVPWAAFRIGVSGRDWAVKWLEVLSYHGLRGKDFVILAPLHTQTEIKQRRGSQFLPLPIHVADSLASFWFHCIRSNDVFVSQLEASVSHGLAPATAE